MVARPAANGHWVETTMSPWTQHHFLAISSAATGSKDLKHGIVIELIVLSSYQKKILDPDAAL